MTNPRSFNDFIKQIYGKSESIFTCVLGQNETGKTDFNLLQLERIHDLGLAHGFGSNMSTLKADFNIDFIEDFETLEKTCRMLNPNPKKYGLKRYFFFGSEIGKWAARDTSWLNTDLIKELQTVRKYGLSMLTDAIDRVDARVLSPRFFAGEFEKPFKENKKFAVWRNYATGQVMQFKDIPKTRIDYDTYETANFYMQAQGASNIELSPRLQIIKKYLETKSWKKAGIHPQEGKNAVLAVLEDYIKHFSNQEEKATKAVSEPIVES